MVRTEKREWKHSTNIAASETQQEMDKRGESGGKGNINHPLHDRARKSATNESPTAACVVTNEKTAIRECVEYNLINGGGGGHLARKKIRSTRPKSTEEKCLSTDVRGVSARQEHRELKGEFGS